MTRVRVRQAIVANHVLRKSLQARSVAGRQVDAFVDTESVMLPSPQLVDQILVGLFRASEQVKDLALPAAEQPVGDTEETNPFASIRPTY